MKSFFSLKFRLKSRLWMKDAKWTKNAQVKRPVLSKTTGENVEIHALCFVNIIFLGEPVIEGCSADDECSLSLACRSRSCINPCVQENPCSSNAICSVSNHRPMCTCPAGTEGDPYTGCKPSESLVTLLNISLYVWTNIKFFFNFYS